MVIRWAAILSMVLMTTLGIAQRGRAFLTIEAHVGFAHSVHLGRLSGLEPSDYTFPPEGQYYGKAYKVTFSVNETIKGAEAKSISFVLNLQHIAELSYLKEKNIELLLFHSNQYSDEEGEFGPGAPGNYYSFRILEKLRSDGDRLGPRGTADQLNINLNEGKFFDLNLNVISGRGKILKRARSFAKKYPGTLNVEHINVPNAFAAQCGYPNAYALVNLPLCEEARKVIALLAKNPSRLVRFSPKADREGEKALILVGLNKFLALFDK